MLRMNGFQCDGLGRSSSARAALGADHKRARLVAARTSNSLADCSRATPIAACNSRSACTGSGLSSRACPLPPRTRWPDRRPESPAGPRDRSASRAVSSPPGSQNRLGRRLARIIAGRSRSAIGGDALRPQRRDLANPAPSARAVGADLILPERRRVAFEPEASQPVCDVHRHLTAPSADRSMSPGPMLSSNDCAATRSSPCSGQASRDTCQRRGAVSSAVERLVYTERVGGSIPSPPIPAIACAAALDARGPPSYTLPPVAAGVAQLVRAPACHAGGRGFEPRHSRQRLPRHRHVSIAL